MKTYKQHLEESVQLDENFLKTLTQGAQKAADVMSKAAFTVLPKEILPQATHEMNVGPLKVTKLDASNLHQFHINANFIPTHTVNIHTGNVGQNYDTHVVGNELGKVGPQVYRKNSNGTYTNISSFRLLHEHPDLIKTHIGASIYHSNAALFDKLPIAASRSDVRRVMQLDPTATIHGMPVSTLQKLAIAHPHASQRSVGHLLDNPNVNQMVLKQAIIRHGMSKEHANMLLSHSGVTHHDLIQAAHNRLAQP